MDKAYYLKTSLSAFGRVEEHDYISFPVELTGELKETLLLEGETPDSTRLFAEVVAVHKKGYVIMIEEGYLGFISPSDVMPVNLHLDHPTLQ